MIREIASEFRSQRDREGQSKATALREGNSTPQRQ
jgi:hypothetical protein